MTSAEIVDAFIDPRAIAVITALAGMNITYFKWLSSKFKDASDKIEKQYNCFERMLNIHESQDQSRHEENLHRFEQISVALARLGSPNGTYRGKI